MSAEEMVACLVELMAVVSAVRKVLKMVEMTVE